MVHAETGTQELQRKMFEAAEAANWKALEHAVAKGADPRGRTLLHWAAGEGHTADVRRLIENGANTGVKDDSGWTPLALAAFAGEAEAARTLIEHGAEIEPKDNVGNTPLHLAASAGYKEVTKILLEKGADIEATNQKGWTPLFSAVTNYRHPNLVNWFLRMGADATARSKAEKTPLDVAIEQRNEAIALAEKEEPTPKWIRDRVKGYTAIVKILETQ
ncbi:MAG: hypothetical protein GWN53_03540 [Gammaproteobacteria bacterium]|nr:hypothetical protein [Gammaproteobacteria bacterium]